MSLSHKEYLSLLQESINVQVNSPANQIVSWKGDGNLPTELENSDIDELVNKIVKGDGIEDLAIDAPNKKPVKESVTKKSPLSILETDLDTAINEDETDMNEENTKEKNTGENLDITDEELYEGVSFTEQESDILTRLINEMDEFENDTFDYQDKDVNYDEDEPNEPLEPENEYELEDLENYQY